MRIAFHVVIYYDILNMRNKTNNDKRYKKKIIQTYTIYTIYNYDYFIFGNLLIINAKS